LTNLTLTVPFGTITLPIFEGSGSISGTDVNISSISWTSLTPNARYSYEAADWSTSVGTGVNVIKLGAEQCIANPDFPAEVSNCNDPARGLLGDYIQGLLQDGSASALIAPATPIATTNVTVTGTGSIGDEVIIARRTEFLDCAVVPAPGPGGACLSFDGGLTFPLNASTLTATFTIVPVPAAVWFFASALGIIGWLRRRATVTA
ncbi:MAG: hypothetical protein JJT85_09395, partial [Chromatiales bacterium]|nr:hypothetical protein [Chromatiales bacterium]